jgi:hypothetical protein
MNPPTGIAIRDATKVAESEMYRDRAVMSITSGFRVTIS